VANLAVLPGASAVPPGTLCESVQRAATAYGLEHESFPSRVMSRARDVASAFGLPPHLQAFAGTGLILFGEVFGSEWLSGGLD
jgi:hypothetical protein